MELRANCTDSQSAGTNESSAFGVYVQTWAKYYIQ